MPNIELSLSIKGLFMQSTSSQSCCWMMVLYIWWWLPNASIQHVRDRRVMYWSTATTRTRTKMYLNQTLYLFILMCTTSCMYIRMWCTYTWVLSNFKIYTAKYRSLEEIYRGNKPWLFSYQFPNWYKESLYIVINFI